MAKLAFHPMRMKMLMNKCKFSGSAGSQPPGVRAARMKRVANSNAASSNGSKTNTAFIVSLLVLLGASTYAASDIKSNPKGTLGKAYYGSVVEYAVNFIYKHTTGQFDAPIEPRYDKLLPDWPEDSCYANIPPGTPCPPTLIVDWERTLISSTYNPMHGWRHVKRPGAEKFLKAMSQYYEVVLFSEQHLGAVSDLMGGLDESIAFYRFGAGAGETRGSKVLKRLDCMNRDVRRIIVIDDNPESVQLCMQNAIIVPPFTDITVEDDQTLENLIPLLQALATADGLDFQKVLKDLGSNDSEKVVAEYNARIAKKGLVWNRYNGIDDREYNI